MKTYAVIISGWEDHELVGLFTRKKKALECAEKQKTNNLDGTFYHSVTVYAGVDEDTTEIYSYTK